MKRLGFVVVCAFGAALTGNAAKEIFVDCESTVSPATGSSAAPFTTIQDGVEAASDGDTVWVRPGVYDRGYGVLEDVKTGVTYSCTNRVCITNSITLKSTDGAAVTHIVGKKASGDTWDTASIRCVAINKSTAKPRIEGFTIRDGGCQANYDGVAGSGGGLLDATFASDFYVVDCVVSNCFGTRGGCMRRGTAIRTWITENKSTANGGIAREAKLYNCLATRNGGLGRSGGDIIDCQVVQTTISENRGAVFNQGKYVNSLCELIGCNLPNSGDPSHKVKDVGHLVLPTTTVNGASFFVDTCDMTTVFAVGAQHQTVAPAFGDYRPLAGSVSATAGDASLECPSWVPEADRYLDFEKRTIPTSGVIPVGCFQTTVAPAGGCIVFGDTNFVVNGMSPGVAVAAETGVNGFCGAYSYAYAKTYPEQWLYGKYVDSAEKPLFCYRFSVPAMGEDTFQDARLPLLDGTLWVMPPPKGVVTTNTALRCTDAGGNFYVNPDPSKGSNDYDGRAAVWDGTHGPKLTIQAAIDATPGSNGRSIVNCAAGTYDSGDVSDESVRNTLLRSRVYIPEGRSVIVRGAGADQCTIKGAPDLGGQDGKYGANSMRCVTIFTASGLAAVQGFTLTEGYCSTNVVINGSTNNGYAQGGAVYGRVTAGEGCTEDGGFKVLRNQIVDCVITNCHATRGGISWRCALTRCVGVGCSDLPSGTGTARYALFRSCLLYGNRTRNQNLTGSGCRAFQTTVVGSANDKTSLISSGEGVWYRNCLFADSKANFPSDSVLVGCLGWNGTGDLSATATYAKAVDCVYANPFFVDAVQTDYRLLATSPAIGRGVLADADFNEYWRHYSCDIDGNPVQFADGRPTIGALQKPLVAVVATTSAGTINGKSVSTNAVEAGSSVTLAYDGTDVRRHYLGMAVDGELQPGSASYTFTAPAAGPAPFAPVCVEATFDANWYVKPDGDDAADGWTPQTARKTLMAAVADAVPGDTVHAAKGEYREGEATYGSHSTKMRVAIPAGVTLEADEGPDKTFIVGASATDGDKYGSGSDAFKCVGLNNKSVLRGFSLVGGRVSTSTMDNYNCKGAGFTTIASATFDTAPTVENCVISNCAAYRASAGMGPAHVVNSRFFCNTNTVIGGSLNGGTVRTCWLYGCVLDRNAGGSAVVFDCDGVWNCTLGAFNVSESNHANPLAAIATFNRGGGIYNTIAMTSVGYNSKENYTDCLVITATAGREVFTNCQTVAQADLLAMMDENYVLTNRDALAVDYVPTCDNLSSRLVKDLAGGQRVYNCKVDVGATEYDWRGDFAASLGAPTIAVTQASPAVTNGSDAVAIADGEISFDWNLPAGSRNKRAFKAEVTGTGTLDIFVNGGEAPTYSLTKDDGTFSGLIKPSELGDESSWTCRYTPGENDEGAALLSGFDAFRKGLMLLVR